MACGGGVLLAVNSPMNRMNQSITLPRHTNLEKRSTQDPLAGRGKGDTHRVIHSAGENGFEAGPIGARTKNVCGAGHEWLAVAERVTLLGERAFRPVDPAVGPEVRSMQIVRAAGERLAIEPRDTLVAHAVAVGVGEFPKMRRRGDVERSFVEECALGKHYVLGEHDGVLETAIAVAILESYNAMRLLRELFVGSFAEAGRIRRVETTLGIKRNRDGPVDEWRCGDELDGKTGGHCECLRGKFELGGGFLASR